MAAPKHAEGYDWTVDILTRAKPGKKIQGSTFAFCYSTISRWVYSIFVVNPVKASNYSTIVSTDVKWIKFRSILHDLIVRNIWGVGESHVIGHMCAKILYKVFKNNTIHGICWNKLNLMLKWFCFHLSRIRWIYTILWNVWRKIKGRNRRYSSNGRCRWVRTIARVATTVWRWISHCITSITKAVEPFVHRSSSCVHKKIGDGCEFETQISWYCHLLLFCWTTVFLRKK